MKLSTYLSPKVFYAGLAHRFMLGNNKAARSSTGMAETGLHQLTSKESTNDY